METLVSDEYKDYYYHDASEHGWWWSLWNDYLHFIVSGYTLYGMIQFKVKFIKRQSLIRAISVFIILHSWYLSIKYTLIATVLYLFNMELETRSISWSDYNCSLLNHAQVFGGQGARRHQQQLVDPDSNTSIPTTAFSWEHLDEFLWPTDLDLPLLYAQFLHYYGGPFKALGNLATLLYGFISVAVFIMLAFFPIYLMYLNVNFNYIRFVLADSSVMERLYANRKRHLDRLVSWSRNQTDSELTLGIKIALNQRDLRSLYADDCNHFAVQMVLANMTINRPPLSDGEDDDRRRDQEPQVVEGHVSIATHKQLSIQQARLDNAEYKLTANLKSLRHRFLATNHRDKPSYCVEVAWRNLVKFKPFVRSEPWFKWAMIVYPLAIFFYFSPIILILSMISIFLGNSLEEINNCTAGAAAAELKNEWSTWDWLTYFENQYTVFAISAATSFYCSYYYGTISELHVWAHELSLQLDLCKIIIELDELNHSIDYYNFLIEHHQRGRGFSRGTGGAFVHLCRVESLLERRERSASTANIKNNALIKQQYYLEQTSPPAEGIKYSHSLSNADRDDQSSSFMNCINDFGGISCVLAYIRNIALASQSQRLKRLEQMAFKLLDKKQTLLRATYINMCLFFDELKETRLMIKTIMTGTTLIAFIFALLASMTRSQFKANYWHLTLLLTSILLILNFYLVYAAIINSMVNKTLVQVHSLIRASHRASSEDADLVEFWVRHIRSFGEDRDVACYKIFGYKITWATILNFDSAVCTAYFYSIY